MSACPARAVSRHPGAARFHVRRARFLLAPLLVAAVLPRAVNGQTPEDRLKAAILTKFPQFVDWPASALANGQTFTLCVTHSHPFGPFLRELVRGERVRNHEITIRELDVVADVDRCHMLFVASGDLAAGFLRRASTRPILTIGDDGRFITQGGIINLRTVDNAVQFEVDEGRARRVGLGINAQLLRLASRVYRSGP